MRALPSLLVLFTLSIATAQEPREPLRGSVVLEDGKPWAGATVHLLSRPMPNEDRIGTPDEVQGTADDKGRFLVQLLPGREYVAWAVEILDGDRFRASGARERVLAGRPLELVAKAPRLRCRVPFGSLAPWRARGRILAEVHTMTTPSIVFAQELTADEWLLPPLPGDSAHLEVRCGDQLLSQWAETIDLRSSPALLYSPQLPRDIRIRVTDETGKVVAGAEILGTALRSSREALLAITGDNGEAIITLPLSGPTTRFAWSNYALGVRAPGFASVGNLETVDIPAGYDKKDGKPAITVKLGKGVAHAVHLHVGKRPFEQFVVCDTQPATSGNSRLIVPDAHRIAEPDTEGNLVVQRHPKSPALLLAATADLPRPDLGRVPLHSMALLAVFSPADQRAKVDVDLGKLVPLVMTVTRDGTPVAAARITLITGQGGDSDRALGGILTDRVGRSAVLVPGESEFTLVAWTDDGIAITRGFSIGREQAACSLELRPVRLLPGRVVDKDGHAVVGARVTSSLFADRGGEPAELATGLGGSVLAESGADGTFTLPLYEGLRYDLAGIATPDDTHYLWRSWTVGRDEPERLDLDLGKPR
ncbi:MAG: carboxypeptidase regulatory-like domain-containing protein [Planctomycetes bacterium]|nr:carboxypeptidase regulatory-like domain-containing protein [Planctomycetota bacterium]